MTQAIQTIISSFPVTSRWVPSCMESLIDKKVAGVALNLLERLVHCFLSWIYCPYQNVYKEKMHRIHFFSDGETRLFDATKLGKVKIGFDWVNDSIQLFDRKVLFNANPNLEVVFSRKAFTHYIVVKDEGRRPGCYRITEHELPRPSNPCPMEKSWIVDTHRPFQQIGGGQVYLVEQPV